MEHINVIGGGLAGCEAAYCIAGQGVKVKLWEMRPYRGTAAHNTSNLAELVCSNSLKSELPNTAQGVLKNEMKILGSLLLKQAEMARVPAGSALAVDREVFSELVTREIMSHPLIEVIREEVTYLDENEICIVATGPLTSDNMADFLHNLTGEENLAFFDAIAPSVTYESMDHSKVFRASRYGKGSDDYLNCALNENEYKKFYAELIKADSVVGHDIDKKMYFNACMPIEVLASKGEDTLRFGPMRPVGLFNPNSEQKPYAILQLRQEDKAGNIYGLVGFQTRMRWGDQNRVLRLIPGLENAQFVRYGAMHRNTYINSPQVLTASLQIKRHPNWFFAGQITGVEGYMESAATGLIAGYNAVRLLKEKRLMVPDNDTLIGALLNFITTCSANFQPMNANFGLLPPLDVKIKDKKLKYEAYAARAWQSMNKFSELFLKQL